VLAEVIYYYIVKS